MISLTINGLSVSVEKGWTILEAAQFLGFPIPTLCHHEGQFCMVHAGLLPQWTVTRARALAAEVEATLAGPGYLEFMAN
ncbi:MAG TPA: 2Fe-2S iron-sulfur cluster-binding protein, partial [Deltaproteobacteria bacterium]|nr:2Fe-2S iron-sulfur cluster-binding protein [Deltaproteobacteria bacterium]